MKKRIALVGVLGIVIVLSAGVRGCSDFTKPIPWASSADAAAASAAVLAEH